MKTLKVDKTDKIENISKYKIVLENQFIDKEKEFYIDYKTSEEIINTIPEIKKNKCTKKVSFKEENVVYIDNWKKFNLVQQEKAVSDSFCNCYII